MILFAVYLPLSSSDDCESAHRSNSPLTIDPRPLRILVVEGLLKKSHILVSFADLFFFFQFVDNDMNQKLLLKMLEQMKFSLPLVAKNGRESVDIFKSSESSIDLIIMDIYMYVNCLLCNAKSLNFQADPVNIFQARNGWNYCYKVDPST
jgi:CheY-like chemotaxis protein